jgi:hypothetical protein
MEIYIITDKDNVIRDISSMQGNLKAGYAFDGAQISKINLPIDITIGDIYDSNKGVFTQSIEAKKTRDIEARMEIKINAKIRQMASLALKAEGDEDFKNINEEIVEVIK